jgi:hypothetical protein
VRQQQDGDGPGLGGLAELLAGAGPGRLCHGQFSVFKTVDGGLHVAYRLDGQDEDGHLPVPAAVIRMALAAASGRGPMGLLGRVL